MAKVTGLGASRYSPVNFMCQQAISQSVWQYTGTCGSTQTPSFVCCYCTTPIQVDRTDPLQGSIAIRVDTNF